MQIIDVMMRKYSRFTTVQEQNELREKYCGVRIPSAPPRSEWMTIDECFDDIIESVEKNIQQLIMKDYAFGESD